MFGNRTVTQRQKYALALFGMVFLMIALVSVSQKQETHVVTGVVVELEDGRVLQGVELTTWGRIMDKLSFLPFINGTPHWDLDDTTPITKLLFYSVVKIEDVCSEQIREWDYYYYPILQYKVTGDTAYTTDVYTGVTVSGYRDWGTTEGAYITPICGFATVEEDAYFNGGYALKMGLSAKAEINIHDYSFADSYALLNYNTSASTLFIDNPYDHIYPFVIDFSLNGTSIATEYELYDGYMFSVRFYTIAKIYDSEGTDSKTVTGSNTDEIIMYYDGNSYTLADFTYELQTGSQGAFN